ncbi:hypothetical protein MKW94_022338 [Papaver nudicaule]|uniref:Nucleoplasmin-like domain-containing protein n=1 Tax=Papaver nudicaule TaxID=74823 RepID=A0AA41VV06_PAPNU|nr:hypothetical protein [Papaver nudicaule]
MAFWGIELKEGGVVTYDRRFQEAEGRLRVTKGCFGRNVSSDARCLVECRVGRQLPPPTVLCILDKPNKIEMCPLDIEFGGDEQVHFSISGDGGMFPVESVHLSGYFIEK